MAKSTTTPFKKIKLVPFEEIAKQEAVTFSLPDLFPTYPDPGVDYGHYAKKIIGKGKYRLLEQYGAQQTGKATYSASSGSVDFSFVSTNGFDYYAKKFVISYKTSVDIVLEVRYWRSSLVIERVSIAAGAGFIYFDYTQPANLTIDGTLGFTVNVTPNTSGYIEVNSAGWREEK